MQRKVCKIPSRWLDGFDARGAQVEDGLELVYGREDDFDDGEQEAQARECYDDAICCSVRGRAVSWDTR